MKTFVFSHPACLEHDTGYSHPESSARLQALLDELTKPAYAGLQWRQAPRVEHGQLARVHQGTHIAAMAATIPKSGRAEVEPGGTMVSSGSGEAAYRAAGAICA